MLLLSEHKSKLTLMYVCRYANRIRKLADNIKANGFAEKLNVLRVLQRNFVDMILRNTDKKSKGKRFTPDEKLLCLSIFKRSAATYRYLGTFLLLPSPTPVKKLLRKFKLDTGITQSMRDLLKDAANRMTDDLDKVCVLMWDEVSLKIHLQYCYQKQKIIGFEDWGTNQTKKYADHALVFMLRGIKAGWKIPLAYNFCSAQTTHERLAWCITEVVRAITKAGFEIAATVCDQGTLNMKAIKALQKDMDKVREEKNIAKCENLFILCNFFPR